MSLDHYAEDAVRVIEAVGVVILAGGGLLVAVQSSVLYLLPARRASAYSYFRRHLGRVIPLGLEVFIIADTIRTVIVHQTAESVLVLATIVAVRIALSWTLTVEIDGAWPWEQARAARQRAGGGPGDG